MKTLLVMILLLSTAQAQAPDQDSFIPTEVQTLRLTVRLKDVQLAQQALYIAQQAFTNEADRVHQENNWPPYVTFNPQTLTYDKVAK